MLATGRRQAQINRALVVVVAVHGLDPDTEAPLAAIIRGAHAVVVA